MNLKRITGSLTFRINLTLFIVIGILAFGFSKAIVHVVNVINNGNQCVSLSTIVSQAVDAHLLRIENATKAAAAINHDNQLSYANSRIFCDSIKSIINADSVYVAAHRSEYFKVEQALKTVWENGAPQWSEPYRDKAGNETVTFLAPLRNRRSNVYAVLCVNMSTKWMKELTDNERATERTEIAIVSPKNVYIFNTDSTLFAQPADTVQLTRIREYSIPYNGINLSVGGEGAVTQKTLQRCGWTIQCIIPQGDYGVVTLIIMIFTYIMMISLFVLLALCILVIMRWYLHPLSEIADATEAISHGNFNVELPKVKQRTDIRQLRDNFMRMQEALKQYIQDLRHTTEQKVSMERDISIAAHIQKGMLPKPLSKRPDIDIYGLLKPAKVVGGDLYDYFIRRSVGADGESHDFLFFCIGDISGKGVAASLLMTVAGHLFRNISRRTTSAARICEAMNTGLAEGNDENMFCTLFVGVLNLTTLRLDFCNAGHNPPVLVTEGKAAYMQPKVNMPLGVMDDIQYESETLAMHKDDIIFLYTDGVNEAENPAKRLFGNDNTLKAVQAASNSISMRVLAANVLANVSNFAQGAEQSDDLTILSLKCMADTPAE